MRFVTSRPSSTFHARFSSLCLWETLRRRVAQRSAQADDASEADLAVLHGQFAALEPLTAEEQASALTIDTEAPQAPQRLLEAVRAMQEEQ